MKPIKLFGKVADAEGARPMEPDSPTYTKIAALTSEMDGIHFVNSLYWKQGEMGSLKARAEYQHRQDRLEEIRAELAKLQIV